MRRLAGLVAVLLAGSTVLAGCSSGTSQTDLQVAPSLVAATPASSPPPVSNLPGQVLGLPGDATGTVVDTRTGTLAVAVAKPAEVLLFALADPAAPPRVVPLPGPVAELSLARDGGPLLAPVPTADEVVRIALPAGSTDPLPVPGGPTSAAQVNGRLLVAVPGHKAVDVFGEASGEVSDAAGRPVRTVTGDVTPEQVVGAAGKVVLLDRLQSAVFDVDPGGGTVGAGLRAGDGATNAVADSFGRVLVADTRTGELLAFSTDPVMMRQRYPVPGAPYGIAFDPKRDLAWLTLTGLNQVVGFDVAGGEPVQRYLLATVRQPNSVAVDPTSGRVFVASADGGGVQVIQP